MRSALGAQSLGHRTARKVPGLFLAYCPILCLFILVYFGYKSFIRYVFCQYFFPVCSVQLSLVVQSCPTLLSHEPQHTRPPCPSPAPGVHPNPCPSSWWCHPTISSSVIPFSSCPQSFPASGSFPMSQLFTSGGQSIGVSASTSVLPMNTQDWSPLGWTGWISCYCYSEISNCGEFNK